VVGGTQRICERMAEELPAGALRLGARVHTIRQNGRGVVVGQEGGEVLARRVIVSLPPALAGRLHYDPPLPAKRDGLTQQMPMGCAIKVQVAYPTPFWRDDGLNGQVLSDGLVSLVYDNSPPDGSCGVLSALLEAHHARLAAEESPEQRRDRVLDFLAVAFGPQAAEPVEYVEHDWMAEEFTRGCYGGHLGPGVWTGYGSSLTAPVGLIHWAGSETADRSSGYMDGAVRAGCRAAREVLAALDFHAPA
jgi:monoamine oxidase